MFNGFIKSRKRSAFVIHIVFKHSALTAKGMQSTKQGMGKGLHLSIESIRKGYLLREKWNKKIKRLDLVAEPPHIKIC